MKNKHYKRSKISEAKFRKLMRYFAMDYTAHILCLINQTKSASVTAIFGRLRSKIAQWSE